MTEQRQMPANSLPSASSVDPSPHQRLMALIVSRHSLASREAAIDLWEKLFKSLVGIIGSEGFEALYDRSLHLAAETYPWLGSSERAAAAVPRFERLTADLQGRDPNEAGEAMALLLSTFTGVLSTLIGQQLTTNILRTAWGDAFEEAALEVSKWPTK